MAATIYKRRASPLAQPAVQLIEVRADLGEASGELVVEVALVDELPGEVRLVSDDIGACLGERLLRRLPFFAGVFFDIFGQRCGRLFGRRIKSHVA